MRQYQFNTWVNNHPECCHEPGPGGRLKPC